MDSGHGSTVHLHAAVEKAASLPQVRFSPTAARAFSILSAVDHITSEGEKKKKGRCTCVMYVLGLILRGGCLRGGGLRVAGCGLRVARSVDMPRTHTHTDGSSLKER